ncbi:hypothetical protein [uncultured Brevundimonas sp.]|uniref:hypothetical protein n=1 Tax=uncultured Brevundimonas sp. TaxID=213418 RepID=UPI0030EC6181|tara:strand:- start:103749 stop:104192 length:444 start_codon:yes stop_codon:yes gene_type:complete
MMTLSRTLALTTVAAALLGLSGWTSAPAPAAAPAPAVTQVSCSELTDRMADTAELALEMDEVCAAGDSAECGELAQWVVCEFNLNVPDNTQCRNTRIVRDMTQILNVVGNRVDQLNRLQSRRLFFNVAEVSDRQRARVCVQAGAANY